MNKIAQSGVTEPKGGIYNPALGDKYKNVSGIDFLQSLIPNLVSIVLIIGSLIFVTMLVMGAIQWISSGGDKQSLEAARGRITNAVIGIIILFAVFAIISVVEVFFGINIMTLDIGALVIQ